MDADALLARVRARLVAVYKATLAGESLAPGAFMETYDDCFQLCSAEHEQRLYDTVVDVLRTEGGGNVADCVRAGLAVQRAAGYLEKHWIRVQHGAVVWGEELVVNARAEQ